MQKLLFFVLFASLSFCGFSQQNQPIKVQATQISSQSDLPEEGLKGEIPTNLRADVLAELVLMNEVSANLGELHPTFIANPDILAEAITGDSAIELIFRDYVMTTDETIHKARETQLLDLY